MANAYYDGFKYRLVPVTTQGASTTLDVTDLESDEAKAFIQQNVSAGISVQIFRSYWMEQVLPYNFLPGQMQGA